MVSWGRSFLVALKIVVFSIVWSIIGGIISFGVTLAMFPLSTAINPNNPTSILVFLLPLFLIGGIISGLGIIATLVKFTIDESVEEVKKMFSGAYPTAMPSTAPSTVAGIPPTTPSTITPTTAPIAQNKKICPFCGAENPPEAKFCKVCGAKLS